MTKVTLIYPPTPWAAEPAMNPPLGLCYIASAASHVGCEVSTLDFTTVNYDFSTTEYLKEIPDGRDFYLVYCMTAQFKWAKEIVLWIQQTNPRAKIMVGGPHATVMPEDFRKLGADYVIRGEGDEVVKLVLTGHEVDQNQFHRVEPPLDRIPFPDRDSFELDRYVRKCAVSGGKAVHLVTLRGCPYRCAFCSKDSLASGVRYRSVDNVIKELDLLIDRHGVRSFVVYDDIFTLKLNRVEEFCREFAKREVTWRCWSRTDTLDRQKLMIMKDSGLTSITLGVESGSDRVLRAINKKTTALDNRGALLLCREAGIPVRCSLMFGNPGETKETLQETVDMIRDTQPDEWNLAVLNPVPGSDIWNDPESFGIRFDRQKIIDSDYVTTNRFGNSGVGEITVEHDHTSKSILEGWLSWFVEELERVCPRKKIQDTIQKISLHEGA